MILDQTRPLILSSLSASFFLLTRVDRLRTRHIYLPKMETVKNFGRNLFRDKTKKSPEGRDEWGSRTAYILASMGGAVGFGNLLRYPSQVFNNNGLQWFIPYLLAITLLAIPVLILEVAIGAAYRG